MANISRYTSEQLRNAALQAQTIEQPDVALTDDDLKAHYLNTPPVKYLYSDLTTSTEYDSGKTVIGLEVIPAKHTLDGVPRYMALTQVGNVDGTKGNTGLTWSNNSGTSLVSQHYTQVPTITSGSVADVNYGTYRAMADWARMPSTNGNGSFSGLTNTRGERYYTSNEEVRFAPSLYGESGDRNPICNLSPSTNVLMDFSGYENTQALLDAIVGTEITVPAATAAQNYASKNGLDAYGVQSYLPAAGELAYIVPNFRRIRFVLTDLGSKAATLPGSSLFWSSSERSASYGWHVNTYSGDVDGLTKTYSYYVRPFLKLPQMIDGHEYVDLGLPSGTKWATMNVGATGVTDYGDYFQYGRGADSYAVTSGRSDYTGTENPLATSADTAAQVWGNNWHMPTYSQCNELVTNTTTAWTSDYQGSGVSGLTFTAQNGNVLFIPAAGFNKNPSSYGTEFRVWTSTPNRSSYAWAIQYGTNAGQTTVEVEWMTRGWGVSVRPVVG